MLDTYAPDRILIEPSGVGKLSDVVKAVENVAGSMDVRIDSAIVVVDGKKVQDVYEELSASSSTIR